MTRFLASAQTCHFNMTPRQKSAQAVLARLVAGEIISSKTKVGGYHMSNLIVMLAQQGHNIKRVRIKQNRRRINMPFQFPEANGYVKYSYNHSNTKEE